MTYSFQPYGVCASGMDVDVGEDGKIGKVDIRGGCSGYRQAIARMAEGMDAGEVASRLRGISCGSRGTSCADQLARCLDIILSTMEAERENANEKG